MTHVSPGNALTLCDAVKVHACLEQYPPHMRDPFKMFGVMDADGSGRIMFNELESFVRANLKLTKKMASDKELGGT